MLETLSTDRPVISGSAFAFALRSALSSMADTRTGLAERIASPILPSAPTSDEAWVVGAYALVLDRAPEPDGLAAFVGSVRAGLTPLELVRALRTSSEGRERRARTPSDTTEVFAWGCYLLALGRGPSQAEKAELRSALVGGQTPENVLAALCSTAEAQAALRFPPAGPNPVEALASAVERIANLPDDRDVHERVAGELAQGARVVDVVLRETRRSARSWRGRLRARLVAPVLAASAHAAAAADVAAAEARLSRDLQWRVEVRHRNERSADEADLRDTVI
ncbi:hypothetical protein BH11ACT1_BH11ACT1_23050 [soil metagenome]